MREPAPRPTLGGCGRGQLPAVPRQDVALMPLGLLSQRVGLVALGGDEFVEELVDPAVDLVADWA